MSNAAFDNPEVMGRSEPPEPHSRSAMTMWPDMTDFQHRFEEIQSDFIDDPKGAVKEAERLMAEAIDRWTKSMHERMQSMHGDTGDGADTERLRTTMRGYREFMQSLSGSRAA
jgi:predicted N-formylglutamate amidohydrolase